MKFKPDATFSVGSSLPEKSSLPFIKFFKKPVNNLDNSYPDVVVSTILEKKIPSGGTTFSGG